MTPSDTFPAGLTPTAGTDPQHVGDYRVVGRIGSGGMGTVYAAVDRSDAPLALKLVHAEYAVDAEFRARFAREVDLLRRVDARCTPRFYGADTGARRPWLATQYIAGPTLRQYVAEHGPASGDVLLGLAAGMAEALGAIHAAGIVHRDLKPGNVILAADGPKVLDFGIARAVEESAITRTGGLLGTPGWIAPEQYEGADPAAASDMFAWGGLVAFAATGRNPFGTGNADVMAFRTMEEAPDLEGVPDELRPLVTAALDKDPGRRPTAAQALTAVTRLWSGHTPADTDEATRLLPGMLDHHWTAVPGSEADTTAWARAAPPRRSVWRRPAVLVPVTAVLALLLAGTAGAAAWQLVGDRASEAGEGGENGSAENGASNEGEEGGSGGGQDPPDLGHGGPDLDADGSGTEIGGVSTTYQFEGEHQGAVLLETYDSLEGGQGLGRGDPLLSITYAAVEAQGDGVSVTGQAEFLRDEGSFTLHAQDFRGRDIMGSAWDPEAPDALAPAEDEVLLELDTENPTGEFTVTVPGAAQQGGFQYVTPELWGYVPQLPDDPVLGQVCYDTQLAEPIVGGMAPGEGALGTCGDMMVS